MPIALSFVLALLLAPALAAPAMACPAEGGPSSFWPGERLERPAEEATAEAIFENCFLAGTLVAMSDGSRKPIEEVRAGDRVKASDPRDGQIVDREVARTFRNVTDTVVDVTWAPLDRVECMAVGPRAGRRS